MRYEVRKVAGWFVAMVVIAGSGTAHSADRPPSDTIDRCALAFVDCATGPNSTCVVGPARLDDDCVRVCRGAYDACLRDTDTRADPSGTGLQPIQPRVPVPR